MTVLTYNYMAVLNSGNNYDCITNINIIYDQDQSFRGPVRLLIESH